MVLLPTSLEVQLSTFFLLDIEFQENGTVEVTKLSNSH